jgi:2-dehydro-3-deoxygalactonokinase
MTGELFAAVAENTILRHSVVGGEHHSVAFETAVRDMLDRPDALVSSLFGVRADGLLRGNESSFSRSRLSGLLIGAELASVREFLGDEPVHIVGDAGLAALYREALATAGHDSVIEASDDLTIAGLATAVSAGEEKQT